MKQVTITLEFERDDISIEDVAEYILELIEDGSLTYEVTDLTNEVIK